MNMEKIIDNRFNIKDTEVEDSVTRVKVFLKNGKNQLLMASVAGGLQLVGGHVEDGEDIYSTVIREIREESGIVITKVPSPFLMRETYTNKHRGKVINHKSTIYYFMIDCDEQINLNNINLTEDEKKYNFKVEWVDISNVKSRLNKVIKKAETEFSVIIAKELLEALDYYKKQQKTINI